MTPSDYAKTASKGPYKGKSRSSIFDLKIKAGSPFTLTDGTTAKGVKWDKKNLQLLLTNRKTVPLSKIVKDIDFGGQPADVDTTGGSLGNKDVEVLSEAFFCYYFAMEMEGKLSAYSPKVWSTIKTEANLKAWTRKIGIESYVNTQNSDRAFLTRLGLSITFLIDKGWHERLVMQINKFFSEIKPSKSKSYEAIRADEVPSEINAQDVFEKLAEKVKTKYGFSRAVDKDKWNPGDVWIFSGAGKTKLKTLISKANQLASAPTPYQAGAVADLNKIVFDLYKSKDLYPVSLKAPSGKTVHISEENVVGSSVSKMVRFVKVDLGATNLDVKIRFAVDLYDDNAKKVIKKDYLVGSIKSKTDTGGFRLEIEAPGAGARFGSIGTENYQWIISNTDDTGIKKLKSVRKEFQQDGSYTELVEDFPVGGEKTWLGASNFQKSLKKYKNFANELQPYMEELFELINPNEEFKKKGGTEILNKTVASEIAVAIDFIKNKLARDVVIENLYDLAASQRFSSGIRADQLERRKGIYGKEAKALGKKEAEYVFESCFYLKVY